MTQNRSTRVLTWTAGAKATDYDIQIGSTSGGSDIVRENTTHTDYTWTGGGSERTAPSTRACIRTIRAGRVRASAEFVFH